MSKLYVASDSGALVDRLANDIDASARAGDMFAPTRIVVPNRQLKKWLRLQLARRLDVAINIEFHLLEDALWLLLRETDPHAEVAPPEAIDDNTYRLMVLAILLETADPSLEPLRRYGHLDGPALSRLSCRRAWFLADELGVLIRNYEYERQDALIQPWLMNRAASLGPGGFAHAMEAAQRTLFHHITREPDGRRALLNRFGERNGKTLPQYAMERMTAPGRVMPNGSVVHFFGLAHLGDLHLRTIAWLGDAIDIRFHCLSSLAARIDETLPLRDTIVELRQRIQQATRTDPGRALVKDWSRAEAETLTLLAPRFSQAGFEVEHLHEKANTKRGKSRDSVLGRLREQLLGGKPASGKLAQDTSLQILACPGVMREVETVHASIVANLRADATLRQTDVAVLVTDMSRYRSALSAVFERQPQAIQFNMCDFNAAEVSTFGQALLGMLELALESFTRARVFAVLLNPCFLARVGVDRSQANVWLEWAEHLGIHHGWDEEEKRRLGYPASPFYAWKLGLQRLRLGRYMDVAPMESADPAPRFGHIVPYADIECTEREALDSFCQAVEGLLPTLARLRTLKAGGEQWAAALRNLIRDNLDVPSDRPEEAQVRENLLPALASLEQWDALNSKADTRNAIPLALVREFVQAQLASIEGSRGEFLTGGVTVAALQPMRPIPATVVYVLGLNEDCFPGSNALSAFDLRDIERLPGDVRPAEQRLQEFLTAILSARSKLYLSYNRFNGQDDQPLQPAVPLVQLQRYLEEHIVDEAFAIANVPAAVDDLQLFDSASQPASQDVLGLASDADRCAVFALAEAERRLILNETQARELAEKRKVYERTFPVPAPEPQAKLPGPIVVSLGELKRFLKSPAEEALRRHLRIISDDFSETTDDGEPLVSSQSEVRNLIRTTLQHVVESAATGKIEDALNSWPARFNQVHADAHLRCKAPEQAFGEIDRAAIMSELRERIHGQGRLETFLRERVPGSFCGPVLLGESLTPVGARLRFPALSLRLPGEPERIVRLVGASPLAWQTPDRFDVLVVTTSSKKIEGRKIAETMIEPTLFFLALLANSELAGEGKPTSAWMNRRDFFVHVAHGDGVQTWQHTAGSTSPTEATQYLAELTRDLLDPDQFDLLPLPLLLGNPELERAFDSSIVLQIDPLEYRQLIIDKVDEARDNPFGKYHIPSIIELIGATVPADALAKVQRRLRMIDRGPAYVRRQPQPAARTTTKRKAKS